MAISGQQFSEIMKYPFQDKQWFSKLCLQGAALVLVSFTLIGIPFAIGYMIRCIQKGIEGDQTLPDWNEWGTYWKLGWKAFAVNLVYMAPLIALWGLIGVCILIIVLIVNAEPNLEALSALAVIAGIVGYGITMLYSLIMWFFQPALFTAVAVGKSFSEAIRFKLIWPYVKANVVTILIGIAIVYLAGMIASAGMFIFFIGILFTMGYSYAVSGYTYGSIYRHSLVKF